MPTEIQVVECWRIFNEERHLLKVLKLIDQGEYAYQAKMMRGLSMEERDRANAEIEAIDKEYKHPVIGRFKG